jgi:hypothetical protein
LITLLFLHIGGLESQAYDLKEYFPLQVGDVRLYIESETEDGQTEWELTREPVSRTETIGEVETFVLGELSGGCWCEEYQAMGWDNQGLKLYREVEYDDGEVEVIDFDPPFLYVTRHLDLGETKKWTAQWGDEEIELEMTLEAVEKNVTVFPGTVLACTFNNCLQTLWRWNSEDESEECRSWFAEGIGLVKEECTETENSKTSTFTMELAAAKVGTSLHGSPLRVWQGELFSFYLAHISTSRCDMLMDNVVIGLPGETPELWWVKFTLNLNVTPFAWTITAFGQGTPPSLDPSSATVCPISGLDFSQALHKINIDNLTLDPQLWMRFPFENNDYKVGFCFPPEKLSWDYYFLDLLQ